MNRKQQIKWRFRRFRLRSAVFMRRNGLYLALAGCLASLGGAAVLIFTAGGNDAPNAPVNRSDDQRLENVLNTVSAESGTPVPAVETPTAGTALPRPTPLALPEFTPMPELSPEPEPTADGVLSGLKPPVDGTVMKSFAINSLLYSETLHQWMTHPGVDIECSKGSEVRAIADGTIENVWREKAPFPKSGRKITPPASGGTGPRPPPVLKRTGRPGPSGRYFASCFSRR